MARLRTDEFDAYVALASEGKNSVARIIVGILVVAAMTIGIGLLIAVNSFFLERLGVLPDAFHAFIFSGEEDASSPAAVFLLLVSVGLLWFGMYVAIRLVHRRSFSTLLGWQRRIAMGDLWRGLAAGIIVACLLVAVGFFVDPQLERSDVPLQTWLIMAAPLALLVLIQASAEELVFRGYLHQSLAARFSSPIVWAGLPTIAFTLLHWYSGALPWMNAAMLVSIGSIAVAMTVLLVRTGNLGAAFGAHTGNNWIALLVFAVDDDLGGASLFHMRGLDDPYWTIGQAVGLTLISMLGALMLVVLLLHPRSPLRVRSTTA
jgi:membrane protease YdiL (CAAX protease family)